MYMTPQLISPQLIFILSFAVLFIAVAICDGKWGMLRVKHSPGVEPYSWSKVQLAWWSIIILSSFITIMFHKGMPPTIDSSVAILMGISGITTTAARVIDAPDANGLILPSGPYQGFILDILSDFNGVSISRFQNVIFNIAFGVWFIVYVFNHLSADLIHIMPTIEYSNLALLGLSSATYAAVKTSEKKEQASTIQNSPIIAADGSVG
jgi:hypothetical protein